MDLQRAIRHRGTGERRAAQGSDACDDALAPEGPFQARGAHRATDASHFRSRAGHAWTDWTAAPRTSNGRDVRVPHRTTVHHATAVSPRSSIAIDLPVADASVRQQRLRNDRQPGRPRTDRGERRADGSNRRSSQGSRQLASIATSAIEQASAGHSICHWSGRWCRIPSRHRSLCRTTYRRGFSEALKTQLGLTLRSTRGPVDILVVDQVERPTEN